MPSAKRQRIRENQARARAERQAIVKKKKFRRVLGIAALVVVALVLVFLFVTKGSGKTVAQTDALTVPCPPTDGSAPLVRTFSHAPSNCIDVTKKYVAVVKTDVGTFKITLDPKTAPVTVNNFVVLSLYHFYNGLTFHRVYPNFVVQGGDPKGNGTGGPGYQFKDELPKGGHPYTVGTVAMANSGANTNGSQFFIIDNAAAGASLPNSYTIFGHVTSGYNVVKKIANDGNATTGVPKIKHHMISVTIQIS